MNRSLLSWSGLFWPPGWEGGRRGGAERGRLEDLGGGALCQPCLPTPPPPCLCPAPPRAPCTAHMWSSACLSAPRGWGLGSVCSSGLVPAAAAAKSLQSCPTLCDPIDGSPPGSPVPGLLQARTLEWAAISFSSAWKWKVKVTSLSCVRLFVTPWTAAYQASLPMGFSRQECWSGLPLPSLVLASRTALNNRSIWVSESGLCPEESDVSAALVCPQQGCCI